jgi:hypothetical protein
MPRPGSALDFVHAFNLRVARALGLPADDVAYSHPGEPPTMPAPAFTVSSDVLTSPATVRRSLEVALPKETDSLYESSPVSFRVAAEESIARGLSPSRELGSWPMGDPADLSLEDRLVLLGVAARALGIACAVKVSP